jgi:CRISPR-associated protein Cas2
MMHLLLIYDVSNDRIRTKIATTCEDYGLDRIQYSAFYGRLKRTHQEELMLKIQALLGDEAGRIQMIPISNETWERRIEVENAGIG